MVELLLLFFTTLIYVFTKMLFLLFALFIHSLHHHWNFKIKHSRLRSFIALRHNKYEAAAAA